jgi:hypothetical protein
VKRPFVIVVLAAVVAVASGVVVALQASQRPTSYTPVAPVAAPRLVLPPLADDIDDYIQVEDIDSMMAGVPWIEGTPQDVERVLATETQREIFDELAACFPARESSPTPEQLFAAKGSCFDRAAITRAAFTEDPTDVFVALKALSLARPDVFTLCHNASHRVGEIALRRLFADRGADFEGMYRMIDAGVTTCQGGLVHGVYDAFGLLNPEVEDFKAAVDACQRNQSVPSGQCADAVGHASWDAFGDVVKTLQACSYWNDSWYQEICAEGVVMRIYQRLEPDEGFYTGFLFGAAADDFIATTGRMCDEWPDEPMAGIVRQNPQNLCHQGVIYLLVKPMFAIVQSNGGDFPGAKDEIYRLVRSIVDVCGTYDEVGEDLCLSHLGPYLTGAIFYQRDEVAGICGQMPPAYVETCVDKAMLKISDAEAGKG